MPLHFMHLIDSTDVLLDPDGMDLDPEEVSARTLWAARDCMANDVKSGHLDLGYRIEVQDESGEVVHRLEFGDALEIDGAGR